MRLFWPLLLALSLLSCERSLPTEDVCYSEHIVPLVREDCATCHTNGEYAVKLQGSNGDYEEIFRYVISGNPDVSPLLLWAEGLREHPPIWTPESKERATVAAWIDGGASETCGDIPDADADADADHDADTDDNDADEEGDADEDEDIESCATLGGLCCGENAHCEGGEWLDSPDCHCCVGGTCGPFEISFEDNVVPRHYRDCRPCHRGGMIPPVIEGTVDDYPVVMLYVDADDPEGVDGWLWWAAGGGRHPYSWPVGSSGYNLFLQWVLQGAENN